MPKVNSKKRNSASQNNPYAHAAAKTKAANSIFKMNTDMGQHVLKNPGVAQAIVDKADLKQNDVRSIDTLIYLFYLLYFQRVPH
jgi:18S rRNA (adenine1779-N6/adenine1780-N6)-dimethyltransferase